jgi:tripartite ATP-independent transporter DctM subunit
MTVSLLGFLAFIALVALFRMPIGFSIGAVGFVGIGLVRNWNAAQAAVVGEFLHVASYSLSVVPLFVLMGNFVTRGGLSRDLYQAANAFLGHRRGGLVASTIVASAGFGAVCGSSIATAATMAKVALPEMQRLGYKNGFAAAAVAAGGTLGILIPPSSIMVIYGLMTETSIGALFAAGVVPGLIAMAFYLLAARWTVARDPLAGPPGDRFTWMQRIKALRAVGSVLFLFVLVMGGLYSGFFTATEAAGIGAFGGFLVAWARGTLSWQVLREVLVESAITSGMLFTILIGAQIFAAFVNFTSMPSDLTAWVDGLGWGPLGVIVAICCIYIVLGCFMESMSMILLTVPVFFPLVTGMGFDPVWFGILLVCVVEIGLITPPLGMNVFVIRATVSWIKGGEVWWGLAPFIVADFCRIAILVAFPALTLYLPRLLNL